MLLGSNLATAFPISTGGVAQIYSMSKNAAGRSPIPFQLSGEAANLLFQAVAIANMSPLAYPS